MKRREPKPFWSRDWLEMEYNTRGRSAAEIATDFGCVENNVLYFLAKHGISRRTMSEVRARKYWGATGADNPMHGRSGALNPHWKGGITPERQSFYLSLEWKSAVSLVWKRDRALCRRCGAKAPARSTFHVHHVASFRHVHLRAEPTNLLLLCGPCHTWVHSRKNVAGDFLSRGNHE